MWQMIVAVTSLLVSLAAVWISWSWRALAKQVADRDRRDWRQRKWFDLYLKANEAYDALDYFQTVYGGTASPSPWGTKESKQDLNNVIRLLREAHAMAGVFPRNAVIDEFFSATEVKGLEEALSKERLKRMLDAVDSLRARARVESSVLD